MLGGSKLNEFVFQYADFANHVTARTGEAQQTFPNGVIIGYNTNTPQTTEQKQVPVPRRLLVEQDGHGRPRARLQGRRQLHQRAAPLRDVLVGQHRLRVYPPGPDTTNGPISAVSRNKPGASANLPMEQFGMYIQDDWRVNDRLTVNAGLRYDIVTGFDLDQSQNPELHRPDRRGRRGPLQRRPRLRGVRQGHGRGRTTTGSRASARSTTCAATARTSFEPARASTTTSATPTPTSSSRASACRAARARSSHHDEHCRHPEPRRHASSRLDSRSATSLSRTRSTRTDRSTARNVAAAGDRAAVDEPDFGRLVARAVADDGHRRRLRAHRGTRSRRPVGAQHARQRRRAALCRPATSTRPTRR